MVPNRRGHTRPRRATQGSTKVGQKAGAREKHGEEPLLWFLWKRQDKAG